MSIASSDLPVTDAVAAATAAQKAIAAASSEVRASSLEALAATLDAHRDELVSIADAETHLGETRLIGELARTSSQLRLFAHVACEGSFLEATIDHADLDATPPIPDLRRMLIPIGPVAVFAASNFPFAFSVLGGDTASGLAAGNPVIVKVHEGHPQLSRRVAELATAALERVGAPDGIFAIIEGLEAGVELVNSPGIAAVGFTGSVSGGRYLFDVASQRANPIPFYGELGSINPVVITPAAAAARLDELADGLTGSFTLGVGQFCTKPGIVFVPAESGLAAAVGERVSAEPKPLLNTRVGAGLRGRLNDVSTRAAVDVVAASQQPDSDAEASAVVLSTTIDSVREHPEVLFEEVFGPVTLLVQYSSLEQVHEVVASVPGSLTATLHAQPDEDVRELLEDLSRVAGRVLYGGWPTGVAVSWAQHHGGPYPSTTSLHTSVGATAIRRWLRPIAYQTLPDELLPAELQEANPLAIPRRVDGRLVTP